MSTPTVLLVNFGGPRSLEEIAPFLTSLLTDEDVIRTPMPRFLEKWFFKRVAKKRALKIAHDYQMIGGKSPIFEDTQILAQKLSKVLNSPVLPFHRYLPSTHAAFYKKLQQVQSDTLLVFPLYPQFSYATTGSIARLFAQDLPNSILKRLQWVSSYSENPIYINEMVECVSQFLDQHHLKSRDVVLLFSAHGVPQSFVDQGDPYQMECYRSFNAIRMRFPDALSILAFQSKFGRGEWLKPYTSDLCQNPYQWNKNRKKIVFIPLSFTSDHIETLFEIEYQYVVDIRKQGLEAFRCPALNQREGWILALAEMIQNGSTIPNNFLIRS